MDLETARDLVLGGAVLGGGGGGLRRHGDELMRIALERGKPRLIPLDGLRNDALVVTVSGVGAPSATEQDVRVADYAESVRLLAARLDRPIAGLVSSENGGFSSANGFVQSALTGIPVVDAPCDGRAHPTGVMGSLGLNVRPGYVSRQAAVGGTPGTRHVALYAEGDLAAVDQVIRQSAVAAGGMIAVARNPVEAAYLRTHAAPGALALAIRLGRLVRERSPRGGTAVAEALAGALGGSVVAEGPVRELVQRATGGYDVGGLRVGDAELSAWNEYMTLEVGGVRAATFPDLVATIGADDGIPRAVAELAEGDRVVVLAVPHARIPLGTGVKLVANLRPIEAAVGKEIVRYVERSLADAQTGA